MPPQYSQGTCTYCGEVALVTRDHIPPESLFPKPRPSNLVTAPSCRKCNNGASMDDEYFRLTLSIRDSAKRPLSKSVADTALRGLQRDQHARFRGKFLQGVREVDIETPDGVYVGRGGVYDVDLERLGKVVTRIIRGLYHHHYKKPLPMRCEVDAWCEDGLGNADSNTIQELRGWVTHLQQNPAIEVGGGVFKYWHSPVGCDAQSDEYHSVWLLLFYESTAFFGVTTGCTSNNTK